MRWMTCRAMAARPCVMVPGAHAVGADVLGAQAGGSLRTSTRPTSNLLLILLLRASSVRTSIPPEGNPCSTSDIGSSDPKL